MKTVQQTEQGFTVAGPNEVTISSPFLYSFQRRVMRGGLSACFVHFFTCDAHLLPFDLGVDFWDFFVLSLFVFLSEVGYQMIQKERNKRVGTKMQMSGLNRKDNSRSFYKLGKYLLFLTASIC